MTPDIWKVYYQVLPIILLEEFIKLNVKINRIIKNSKYVELNKKIVGAFLNTQIVKGIWENRTVYVVTCIIKKKFVENLMKRFLNTYKISNHDINNFMLLLPKSIYPCGYMGDWVKFDEKSLTDKKDYYSHLTWNILLMQITRAQKKVCKNLEMKKF